MRGDLELWRRVARRLEGHIIHHEAQRQDEFGGDEAGRPRRSRVGLASHAFRYVREPDEEIEPGATSIDGVFVAGTASAMRDIPDTILHSGAAAAQVASYLRRRGARP